MPFEWVDREKNTRTRATVSVIQYHKQSKVPIAQKINNKKKQPNKIPYKKRNKSETKANLFGIDDLWEQMVERQQCRYNDIYFPLDQQKSPTLIHSNIYWLNARYKVSTVYGKPRCFLQLLIGLKMAWFFFAISIRRNDLAIFTQSFMPYCQHSIENCPSSHLIDAIKWHEWEIVSIIFESLSASEIIIIFVQNSNDTVCVYERRDVACCLLI